MHGKLSIMVQAPTPRQIHCHPPLESVSMQMPAAQARCAAAVRDSKETMAILHAERELWAFVRAAYVSRAFKLRMAAQRKVGLSAAATCPAHHAPLGAPCTQHS